MYVYISYMLCAKNANTHTCTSFTFERLLPRSLVPFPRQRGVYGVTYVARCARGVCVCGVVCLRCVSVVQLVCDLRGGFAQ